MEECSFASHLLGKSVLNRFPPVGHTYFECISLLIASDVPMLTVLATKNVLHTVTEKTATSHRHTFALSTIQFHWL